MITKQEALDTIAIRHGYAGWAAVVYREPLLILGLIMEAMDLYAEQSNSHKPVVMQAEVSDVSEGATVGQRSVVTNAVRWDCKVCGKSFDENYELYEHYDTEHNKGAEVL